MFLLLKCFMMSALTHESLHINRMIYFILKGFDIKNIAHFVFAEMKMMAVLK
jgi:hypothetical protein